MSIVLDLFAAAGFPICSLPLPLMEPHFLWVQHLAAFKLKCQAFLEGVF